MAYQVIQASPGTDGSANTATNAATTTITQVGAGNAVMGVIMYTTGSSTNSVPTNATDATNTYAIVDNPWDSNSQNGLATFYKVNCLGGGGTTLTVNFPSSVIRYYRIMILEVSGIAALDQHIAGTPGFVNANATITSGALPTLGQTGDFLYGVVCDITGGNSPQVLSAGTNIAWQIRNNAGTGPNNAIIDMSLASPYSYGSTTGVAATGSGSFSTGFDGVAAAMAFSPSVAAPGLPAGDWIMLV